MVDRFLYIWKHRRLRLLLSAYIDGKLSQREARRLEGHLAACKECGWELDTLKATVGVLRKVTLPQPSRPFALRRELAPTPKAPAYDRPMLAAASVAVLLLVVLLMGDLTGLLSQQGAAGDAGPAQKVKVTESVISEASTLAPATAPTPLPSPPPVPAAAAPWALAPSPEPTPQAPQSKLQDESRKNLTVGEVTPEPVKATSTSKTAGLSIPLWQLEVSLGGLAAFLGAVLAWMARRSRQRRIR